MALLQILTETGRVVDSWQSGDTFRTEDIAEALESAEAEEVEEIHAA